MTRKIVTVDATTLALPPEVEAALKADLEVEFDTQVTAAADSASSASASASAAEAAAAEATAPTQEMVDASIDARASTASTGDTLALRNGSGQIAVTTPSSGSHAVNLTYLNDLGLIGGEADKKYKMVAGVIRNAGGPNYWQPISDATHEPANVDSVATTTDRITIDYTSIGATKVVSFVAGADEQLAKMGVVVGPSVGLTSTYLQMTYGRTYADFVEYNGTSWVSANGVFTPTYTVATGTLKLDHPLLPAAVTTEVYDHHVTGRGALLASSHGGNDAYCQVRWHDYAGTLQTTASTNQRAFVSQGVSGLVDPQKLDTTLFPSSNIWFLGVFEVA